MMWERRRVDGWRAIVVRLMFDRKRKEGDAGSLLIPTVL